MRQKEFCRVSVLWFASGIADCDDNDLLVRFVNAIDHSVILDEQLSVALVGIASDVPLRGSVGKLLQRENLRFQFVDQRFGSVGRQEHTGNIGINRIRSRRAFGLSRTS